MSRIKQPPHGEWSAAALDPDELSPAERIDLLVALSEQQSWIESARVRVLAAIDNSDASDLGLAQEEVSLALRVPVRAAQARLRMARTLTGELPATLGLLATGQITARHAEVIVERSWLLDPGLVAEFEALVLKRVAEQTVRQVQSTARRAAMRLDPATAQQRHERALQDRSVGFQPGEDGMVQLPVLLGAVEGQLIFTRLTAAARLLPAADSRTMDQKRADLLVDAVLTGLPHDALPELQGRRPSIQVVVSADTLLNLDDEPAHLTGYGPVSAPAARRLAADQSGTWRRLLTDLDTGHLLDISPHRYRPSQRLRDYVDARDSVCVFPTCDQPGCRCELDHATPWTEGGTTHRNNTALLCKRHNNAKINTGLNYLRKTDGTHPWTTPTRHTYPNHPPQRWTTIAHENIDHEPHINTRRQPPPTNPDPPPL